MANAIINGRAPVIRGYKFFILIPLVLKIAMQGQQRFVDEKRGQKAPAVPHGHVVRTTGNWFERCRSGRWRAAATHTNLLDLRVDISGGAGAGFDGGNSDTAHGVTLSSGDQEPLL
jgi:hypothetical protein